MDKKIINYIKNDLRNRSRQWSVMTEVRNSQRTRLPVGHFKNGKVKSIWAYWCFDCGELYEGLEVDHISEVGKFDIERLTEYVKRLFCSRDNLVGLCHDCHLEKTNAVRESLKDL